MLNEITKINFDAEAAAIDPAAAFIEGVRFAAAVIQDHRARMNFCFEANARRNPKTTKRAYACNEARNKEAKNAADFLLYITKPGAGFDRWIDDYKNGNLWKLDI